MKAQTEAEALTIAKAFLKGTPDADRPLVARREGETWVVTPERPLAEIAAGLVSLTIDAKSGQVLSADVLDVAEIKPVGK